MLKAASIITCVSLGLWAASAMQSARAAPPVDVSGTTFDLPQDAYGPGQCAFPIKIVLQGKGKQITLPGNRLILTSPKLRAVITNQSDTTKSVTLNITGATHQSVQNGNTVSVVTGRNLLGDPVAGIVLGIGTFSFIFDATGNLVQPLLGNGQLVSICNLVS